MFEKIVTNNNNIASITVPWNADFDELMGVLKNFFDDNNPQHLLLDLRNCSFDTITHDHIRDLCGYDTYRADGESRFNGKTALVGSNDLQLEICRIFKTYSEMIGSAIKFSVFPSLVDAFAWLEEG